MSAFELIPLGEIDERHIGAWGELAGAACQPNPFFEPGYVLPLARNLGQLDGTYLAVTRSRDAWLACLPIRQAKRWHRAPLPNWSTWRANPLYSLLGTPLVARGEAEAAVGGLLPGLLDLPGSWLTGLDWLQSDGAVIAAIRACASERGYGLFRLEQFERALLKRRPNPDYLEQTLGAKKRKELRRQRRRLSDLLGGELETVKSSEPGSRLDALIALEAQSRFFEHGSALASDPRHEAFFRQACENFAEQGRLRLLSLEVDGKVVAVLCDLFAGEGIFSLKTAYDEEYARFSPGVQLEAENMLDFHGDPTYRWVDSCAVHSNVTMNRLWGERRLIESIALGRGAKWAVARGAAGPLKAIRDRRIESVDRDSPKF